MKYNFQIFKLNDDRFSLGLSGVTEHNDGKYVGKCIPNQRRKTKTGGFLKIQSSFCVDKLGTLTFMSFLFSIAIFLSRILPIIVCPFSFGR
jgi:hypothetical protein